MPDVAVRKLTGLVLNSVVVIVQNRPVYCMQIEYSNQNLISECCGFCGFWGQAEN